MAKSKKQKAKPGKKRVRGEKTPTVKSKQKPNLLQKLSLPVLLLICLIVFLPLLNNEFTNWDDPFYIERNEYIKSINPSSVAQLFSPETIVSSNYHPLTLLSFAINYHFSELNPQPYILTNIIIHLLNVLLVFFFIYQLSKKKWWLSILVAALFAIHPMHVESVAWISERKDVLYTFFFISGLITYLRFIDFKKYSWYALTLVLFVLSMFSKSAATPFPLVLLLLDFYQFRFPVRNSIPKLIVEKIPFFLIAFFFGYMALNTQSGAIGVFEKYGIIDRFAIASYGLVMYVVKFFVPFKLAAFYPRPPASEISAFYYMSIAIVLLGAAATVYSLRYSRRWFFGIGFFFVMIALVLQFFTVGGAGYADRYTYVPYIGLFYLFCMETHDRLKSHWSKSWVIYTTYSFIIIVLMIFAGMSRERGKVWLNSGTLWTDVIDKYPKAARAYLNRGEYRHEQQQYAEAVEDYKVKISMEPHKADAYMNLGMSLFHLKRYQEAIDAETNAIERKPDYAEAYRIRGNSYYNLQQYDLAMADYEATIKYNPKDARAQNNIGNIFFIRGQMELAVQAYSRAVELSPDNHLAWGNRGIVNNQLGRRTQARDDLIKALSINPGNGGFWSTLAEIHFNLGDKENARIAAQKAQENGMRLSQSFLDQL